MGWKFVLYILILIMCLTLVSGATGSTKPPVKVVKCYACSWTAGGGYSFNCLNQTESEGTVNCNGTCKMNDMWDKKTGELKSVYRGCGYKEKGSVCVPDYTNVNCITRCDTDKCNAIHYDVNHTLNLGCYDYHCANDAEKFRSVNILTFVLLGYFVVFCLNLGDSDSF